MEESNLKKLEIQEFNTIIIGSGAAGLNCALHLVEEGIAPPKIAIVTEKLGGGTSFNTGSDKQTYYKMSIIGEQKDSPLEMARDMFMGGAMHGNIALIEATNSIREFFHLVQLGVPFPQDKYGGYAGYKTDNDSRQRATSIGPLTSQKMSDCLLKAVKENNIKIFDNHYGIKILLNTSNGKIEAMGLLSIKTDELREDRDLNNLIQAIKVFKARNIVIATGGPAMLYKHSVYPLSQKGSMGLAIDACCKLQNLTESQFGLASTKFRWNVSGSYQQVIPRYYSLDGNNNESEFLNQYFPSFKELSRAIFFKGYQWPFNVDRVLNKGSSLIDLAVYNETEIKGRKVYLDFTKNPKGFDLKDMDDIAKEYLMNSKANEDTPIKRLRCMNEKAYQLYMDNNIDLETESLELAVCNQHLNGGISGDIWWETTTKHLFAIGEINGSHGIHRPGGAALNAGQVGGLRAAQKIANVYNSIDEINMLNFKFIANKQISILKNEFQHLLDVESDTNCKFFHTTQILDQIQSRMSRFGCILRPWDELESVIEDIKVKLRVLNEIIFINNNREVMNYLRVKDAFLTHLIILQSILNYHEMKGRSRGSYLILRNELDDSIQERMIEVHDELAHFKYILSDNDLSNRIQTIQKENDKLIMDWEDTREIPNDFDWFENTWKNFSNKSIYK